MKGLAFWVPVVYALLCLYESVLRCMKVETEVRLFYRCILYYNGFMFDIILLGLIV